MDKRALFTPDLPECDIEIPGRGTVRVRGLSRIEALLLQKLDGYDAQERRLLRYGMVDPQITEADAERWQRASVAGELEPVVTKITELSGMLPGAGKEAVRSFREQPGDGVRVLPGDTAVDDGGPDAPGDA